MGARNLPYLSRTSSAFGAREFPLMRRVEGAKPRRIPECRCSRRPFFFARGVLSTMKTRGIFAVCALAALAAGGGCSSRKDSDSLEQAVGQCAVPGAALDRVFPGVSFKKPTAMTQDPSDKTRFYVVEKEGGIKTITTAPGA